MFEGKARSLLYKEVPESFDAKVRIGWGFLGTTL
jgi:hypothetical protein